MADLSHPGYHGNASIVAYCHLLSLIWVRVGLPATGEVIMGVFPLNPLDLVMSYLHNKYLGNLGRSDCLLGGGGTSVFIEWKYAH